MLCNLKLKELHNVALEMTYIKEDVCDCATQRENTGLRIHSERVSNNKYTRKYTRSKCRVYAHHIHSNIYIYIYKLQKV